MPRPVSVHCIIRPVITKEGHAAKTNQENQQGGDWTGFSVNLSLIQYNIDILSTK